MVAIALFRMETMCFVKAAPPHSDLGRPSVSGWGWSQELQPALLQTVSAAMAQLALDTGRPSAAARSQRSLDRPSDLVVQLSEAKGVAMKHGSGSNDQHRHLPAWARPLGSQESCTPCYRVQSMSGVGPQPKDPTPPSGKVRTWARQTRAAKQASCNLMGACIQLKTKNKRMSG